MALSFPKVPANNPALRGKLAARKQFFGPASRFAVAPVHTRFDAHEWFVWDASLAQGGELPPVIRQSATLDDAVRGLPVEEDGDVNAVDEVTSSLDTAME